MKLTKNLVAIVSSLWTRFSIKKKLYANVHTDVIPSFPLFTYFHILKKLPSSQPRPPSRPPPPHLPLHPLTANVIIA